MLVVPVSSSEHAWLPSFLQGPCELEHPVHTAKIKNKVSWLHLTTILTSETLSTLQTRMKQRPNPTLVHSETLSVTFGERHKNSAVPVNIVCLVIADGTVQLEVETAYDVASLNMKFMPITALTFH